MANIKSAKKRIQVIAKKTAKNNRIKHKIKKSGEKKKKWLSGNRLFV